MESISGLRLKSSLIAALHLPALLLVVEGCSSSRRSESVSESERIAYRYLEQKDTTLEGWDFKASLNFSFVDSLMPGEQVIVRDTTNLGALRGLLVIERDRNGKLRIQCQEQGQTVLKLRRELQTLQERVDQRSEVKSKKGLAWWSWGWLLVVWLVTLLGAFALGWNRVRLWPGIGWFK